MRKAIVVALDCREIVNRGKDTANASLEELNQHLTDGWFIVDTLPMSGTDQAVSVSVVVLERI